MSDMIKIKRKNYIEEKAKDILNNNNIDEQIKSSGVFLNDRYEKKWRVQRNKKNFFNPIEDKFEVKQIIKRYQTSKDEFKGYNSKYLHQLTDLLDKKNKNFAQKRFQLYNKRINSHDIIFNNNGNNFKKSHKTLSPVSSKLERMFNSKKHFTVNMFSSNNKFGKNKKMKKNLNINNRNSKNNLYKEPLGTINSSNKKKILQIFRISKSEKNLFNNRKKTKITKSIISSESGSSDEDTFDNQYKGKEKFIISGDMEKYQEYLHKKYNFIENNDINHMIYLYEINERNKLYKNIPKYNYLEKRKTNCFRKEFFSKIEREKKKKFLNIPKLLSRNNELIYKIERNKQNKLNFIKDCKKILLKDKSNLL